MITLTFDTSRVVLYRDRYHGTGSVDRGPLGGGVPRGIGSPEQTSITISISHAEAPWRPKLRCGPSLGFAPALPFPIIVRNLRVDTFFLPMIAVPGIDRNSSSTGSLS